MPKVPTEKTMRFRKSFYLSRDFHRDRELMDHLLKDRSSPLCADILNFVLFGFEVQIEGQRSEFLDDNFPWIKSIDNYPERKKIVRCQFVLSLSNPLHSRLQQELSSLTQDRQSEVLRRIALIGFKAVRDFEWSPSRLKAAVSFSENSQISISPDKSKIEELVENQIIPGSITYSVPIEKLEQADKIEKKIQRMTEDMPIEIKKDQAKSDKFEVANIFDHDKKVIAEDDGNSEKIQAVQNRASELRAMMGMVVGMSSGKMIRSDG